MSTMSLFEEKTGLQDCVGLRLMISDDQNILGKKIKKSFLEKLRKEVQKLYPKNQKAAYVISTKNGLSPVLERDVHQLILDELHKEGLATVEITRFFDEDSKLESESGTIELQPELWEKYDEWKKWYDEHGCHVLPQLEFLASPDYTSVTFKGEKFILTPQQAKVVEILHRGYLNGTRSVNQNYILEQLETNMNRLRDVFKSKPDAWKKLIIKDLSKGSYRLNF